MAGNALLVDTDILIDYLKGIEPARALVDAGRFDLYYSSWTRKELLAKTGLRDSERREVEALRTRCRIVPVDDAIAERYWTLLKKYRSRGLASSERDHCGHCLAKKPSALDAEPKALPFYHGD